MHEVPIFWFSATSPNVRGSQLFFTLHPLKNIKDYIIFLVTSGHVLRAGIPRDQSLSPGTFKNFLCSTSSRPTLGPTHSPSQWISEALSTVVKRQERETDHSFLTSAEFKKMWTYISTSPYAFMAQCLIS
jgi:hypothetical protein